MDVDWLVGEGEAVAYVVPLHAEAQALHVLKRAGPSPRSTGNAMPGGLHAMIGRDDTTVAIVVPKADVAAAKTLLPSGKTRGRRRSRSI